MAYIGQPKNIIKRSLDEFKINFDELTDDLQFVAEKCGIDIVFDLLKNLQGTNIYIPKVSRLKDYNIRYIETNKDKSIKQLADELGVSENHIRKLKYDIKLR